MEAPCPGEDRALIPSPKVATYDLKPEMSAFEVTDEVIVRLDGPLQVADGGHHELVGGAGGVGLLHHLHGILIPSPTVPTYDLKPEMSAFEVTDEVIARLDSGKYDVIILNFANCDMVGHFDI